MLYEYLRKKLLHIILFCLIHAGLFTTICAGLAYCFIKTHGMTNLQGLDYIIILSAFDRVILMGSQDFLAYYPLFLSTLF